MTSLSKIAEQVKYILGFGDMQPILASVIDCYSSVVKKEFYENKSDGMSEIDGAFIYTFKKIVPVLDIDVDQYYIKIPSSYLRLPHEMGVNYVGFALGQTKPFVRINSGSIGMWNGLKAAVLGGSQTYYIEGNLMYFPKMTSSTNGDILLKLAIALDTEDVDFELNIPRSMVDNIVNMVLAKFQPKQPVQEKVTV